MHDVGAGVPPLDARLWANARISPNPYVLPCVGTRHGHGALALSAEKYYWLICCERKILFRLKKQAEKDRL
jgi:hypothetical protein